mmetsp:Transcript_63613/g.170384  ORF Transcript_63613/g.170384 Transcript_63613/m.170384 type:complete len:200 (+) Transcript_63613:207-806(+)
MALDLLLVPGAAQAEGGAHWPVAPGEPEVSEGGFLFVQRLVRHGPAHHGSTVEDGEAHVVAGHVGGIGELGAGVSAEAMYEHGHRDEGRSVQDERQEDKQRDQHLHCPYHDQRQHHTRHSQSDKDAIHQGRHKWLPSRRVPPMHQVTDETQGTIGPLNTGGVVVDVLPDPPHTTEGLGQLPLQVPPTQAALMKHKILRA